MALNANVGAPNFYQALSAQLASKYPGYQPIEAQGDFNFNWQGLNDPTQFNANTFTQINSVVQPGQFSMPAAPTLSLAPSQTFGGGWSTLLNQMVYTLSKTENAQLVAAQSASLEQQASVVAAYTQSLGPVTQAMMTAAATAMGKAAPNPFTPFDFIVDYTMCWVWSGFTQGLVAKPLTYMQIQQGQRVPSKTFPAMPAGGAAVLGPMASYLGAVNSVLAIQAELATGTANLLALQQNTASPTLSDPLTGMNTITSQGGGSTVNAWEIQTSPQSIGNGLGGVPPTMPASSSLQVVMTASKEASDSFSVSIEGQAGFTVGTGWLDLGVSGGASYDMTSYDWAGSSYIVTATYDYPTTVSNVQPMTYDPNTTNGWVWGLALQQAAQNYALDQASPGTAPNNSGYNFLNAPAFSDLGQGGNFGYLNNLLISLYPTISINYVNGDYSSYQSQFSQNVSGSLTLFGLIKLASVGESTQSLKAQTNASGQGFTLTIAPPLPSQAVGYYDQTSCIVAALPAYPGAPAAAANFTRALSRATPPQPTLGPRFRHARSR